MEGSGESGGESGEGGEGGGEGGENGVEGREFILMSHLQNQLFGKFYFNMSKVSRKLF